MIALSTAWYPRSRPRLEATIEAIAAMGFQAIEVGVSDSVPFRMKELEQALKKTLLKVVSVHNVCAERKLERTNRRGDWLASPDAKQRRVGVEATLETIKNAQALGAPAVVLHLGSPAIEARWEKQLLLYELARGGVEVAIKRAVSSAQILAERKAVAGNYLAAASESIAELLERSSGVRLGIECRLGWHELPNLDELGVLLERFPDPRVGYWHDVGHAVIQDFLGLGDHLDWLRLYASRTIGIHLHDVHGGTEDHYPPGLGEVRFKPVLRVLPADALRVMEISSGFIAEEIVLGRRRLEEIGF